MEHGVLTAGMQTRRKARSKARPALLGIPSEVLPLALSFLPLRCSARLAFTLLEKKSTTAIFFKIRLPAVDKYVLGPH